MPSHVARTVVERQRLRSHLCPLHPGSGKRGRPQLSPGGELADAGAHPGAAQWPMESVKNLLAFDREAHPRSLQYVSDAGAPP